MSFTPASCGHLPGPEICLSHPFSSLTSHAVILGLVTIAIESIREDRVLPRRQNGRSDITG